MVKINRTASAAWSGGLKDGKGSISTESGALKAYPYGFAARFEGQKRHQSRGASRRRPRRVLHHGAVADPARGQAHRDTDGDDREGHARAGRGGFAITAVHLTLKAKIPGADQETFEELANKAKAGCPVSKVIKATITLDATLEA